MSADYVSKSDYIFCYRYHPAWLWLKKHDPDKLPEIPKTLQERLESGKEFEPYAEAKFPNAVRIDAPFDRAAAETKKALESGATAILQGQFRAGELLCIADVLLRNDDETVDLVEIKSSTKAKPEHEWDLAFQKILLERAGYPVKRCRVMHLNKEYIRQGEIDSGAVVAETDITEKVEKRLAKAEEQITDAVRVLHLDSCPDLSPKDVVSALSKWREVYLKMHPELPETTIYRLPRLTPKLTAALEDAGIERIEKIDLRDDSFKFNPNQTACIQSLKDDQPVVNEKELGEFLDSVEYPLYFYDYETAAATLPLFDGMKPHGQVPIQYSLHILHKDGRLEHKEFLHREASDPSDQLAQQLHDDVGEAGTAVAWHKGTEIGLNEKMAEQFPQHKEFLSCLTERTIDLMDPFDGMYADGHCFGSASLKAVLPVMVPHLSYTNLDIGEGLFAQQEWIRVTVKASANQAEREKVYKDLLTYCKLDTLAMVRIFQVLLHRCSATKKKHPSPPITNDVELGEVWLITDDMSETEKQAIDKGVKAQISAVSGN
ncbi:MAG: DUF2779 domain-containing protein [bacterium]|nr:DUF2779 domain-containing protein [bacterium]